MVCVFILSIHSYKTAYAFNEIQLKDNGLWCLYDIKGKIAEAHLLGATTVFPSLISLVFKTEAGNQSVIIAKDGLINHGDWKSLRFTLKVYSVVLLKVTV